MRRPRPRQNAKHLEPFDSQVPQNEPPVLDVSGILVMEEKTTKVNKMRMEVANYNPRRQWFPAVLPKNSHLRRREKKRRKKKSCVSNAPTAKTPFVSTAILSCMRPCTTVQAVSSSHDGVTRVLAISNSRFGVYLLLSMSRSPPVVLHPKKILLFLIGISEINVT